MTDTPDDNRWQVYIIESTDGRLYTGITTDVERRWNEHLSSPRGAKFFRGRSPKALRFVEPGHNRSSASKREAEIKKLTRPQKLVLIETEPNLSHFPSNN